MKRFLVNALLIGTFAALCCISSVSLANGDPACGPGEVRSSQQSKCIKAMNAAALQKAACANSTSAITPSCSKSYSCEGLFQEDHAVATKCNYDRCKNERDISYCTCKYGTNGDGKSVGIPLNTNIPFLGNCVGKSDGSTSNTAALTAFPTIIQAVSKMLVTVILLFGFIMVVVGGVQWASGDAKSGMEKIKKVAIGFAILGFMGAILRFINPNFFT